MTPAYIAWHLGLGDAVVMNGMIRELVIRHGQIVTYAKPHNLKAVRHMFSDLPGSVIVHKAENDSAMFAAIALAGKINDAYKIGFNNLNRAMPFDQSFFQIAGVPFDCRWSSFFVPRNFGREGTFADYWQPLKKFIVVHDDARYKISDERLPKLPILRIESGKTDNIFNYMTLLDNADEIHVMDSVVMFICDSYQRLGMKTTVHRYARQNPANELPTLRYITKVIT